MNLLILRTKKAVLSSKSIPSLLLMFSMLLTTGHSIAEPAQEPLFLTTAATPVVIFSMSRDHELFKKAYNDYTNMDGGVMTMRDTTYNNEFSYYGYFDSAWCYSYADSKFSPSNQANNHQCNGSEWSGNFLNWATMTRMDILRRVLYGGKRAVDTAESTVLERTYLPRDNHAFAKVYNPASKGNTSGAVNLYTPYTNASISLCNVSKDGLPEIRVAKGEWFNWANTEVIQCEWDREATNPDHSKHAEKSQLATYIARVDVCVNDKDDEAERCTTYDSNIKKPTGVLQEYEDTINFGLVTGTWEKNRSGGILRKKAGPLVGNRFTGETDTVNEYDRSTGIFNPHLVGIIGNIDRFQINGYGSTSYNNVLDWGNPVGEIYAETLRYLSGRRPKGNSEFSESGPTWNFFGDGNGPSGISKVDVWDDPLASARECTKCSVILISSGPNSWDSPSGSDTHKITDGIVGSIAKIDGTDVTLAKLNSDYTNKIGTLEFGSSKNYFNGGTTRTTQCTSVTLGGLAEVKGLCPEEPMGQGSYVTAGLAYLAKTNSIRSDQTKTINTFAVELSQGLPSLDIPVGDGSMSIVPICMSQNGGQTCSLVSVRVEDIQLVNDKPVRGSYLFYWEDQESGSDHDMDAVQRIEFCIGTYCADFGTGAGTDANSTHRGSDKVYKEHSAKLTHNAVGGQQLRVINTIPYWATGAQMSLSYIISGTGSDGLQNTEWVKRGGYDNHYLKNRRGNDIDSSLGNRYWYNTIPPDGSDYLPADINRDGSERIYLKTKIFSLGTSTTNRLKTPLYYAAKYGNFDSLANNGAPIGWDKKNNSTGAETPDGIPDAYFSVNNPSLLEPRLKEMLGQAAKKEASATAVATNSTRLTEGSKVYQAIFNSETWAGRLSILEIDSENKLKETNIKTEATGATTFRAPAARAIYTSRKLTSGASQRQPFLWDNLTDGQKLLLRDGGSEALGQSRVNWLRGDQTSEGELLRIREFLMGDVVNSSPVISGRKNARYQRLAGDAGVAYQEYDAPNLLFVGANDGKLHAFNPDNLNEVYAYVPNAIYHKLARVTSPNYGTGGSTHQYLVDGPLFVGDAYLNDEWRTIVVGTFGAGARGLYALDVTDAVPTVLFEYTEADYPQLGYMLGQAQIAPLTDGTWAIVAGNGYHYSGSPTSQLVVISLTNGTVHFIDTGAGRGLSDPALLPNVTGSIEYAYAGDLDGNLWKFDLKNGGSTSFSSSPLFTAKDARGNVQPISAMPTLGLNQPKNNSVMVYFGTGKYFDVGDNTPTQFPVQSFYAIADTGAPITYTTSTRSTILHEKTITQNNDKRTISGERSTVNGVVSSAVDWKDIYGWYVDFIPDHGERVITKPQLVFDRLIFTTLIPSGDPCRAGGFSWLMELVGVGNKSIAHNILDPDDANKRRDEAVVSDMGLGLGSKDNLLIPVCDVSGTCDALVGELESGARGRMSWKQVE